MCVISVMVFLSQVSLEPVSNTVTCSLYASALLTCDVERKHNMQISTFVDVVSSIISEICEPEMMVIHPPRLEWLPTRSKVKSEQLASVSVCSSARWTSCCCASWCREALHRRLLETAERRRARLSDVK